MQNVDDAVPQSQCNPARRATTDQASRRFEVAKRSRRAAGRSQLAGTLWFGGWLFAVGFANLAWWKIPLAILLWPYFLGANLR